MVRLGKFDDAFAMLDNFSRRFPGNPRRFEFRSLLVSSMGDYEEAVRLLNTMKDSGQSNPGVAIDANEHLADVAATRGQLGEARRYLSENIARNDERRLASQSLPLSIDIAQLDIHVRRQPAEGTARIEEALRRYPLDGMAPADRPYVQLIGAFAEAGQPDRARHFLEEYDTQVHPELRAWNERIMLNDGRAALALAEGRLNPAIDTARLAAASGCPRCPLLTLGRALEAAGQQDSAIAVYERYVSEPSLRRTALLDRWHLGWILERLGELHEQRGNVQKAAQYYGQFVELWKDADSELQPRVNAARNRLQRIVGPRG
jgi:tetratricopeptide (TPR) repeat protein